MRVVLITLLVALTVVAHAEAETDCEGDIGSTLYQACVLYKTISELDAELNVEYRRILDSHPKDRFPKENELLVEAQRAWIRYRDKVCDFEDQAIGGAYSISLMRCKARITENRLNEFIQIYGDKI